MSLHYLFYSVDPFPNDKHHFAQDVNSRSEQNDPNKMKMCHILRRDYDASTT